MAFNPSAARNFTPSNNAARDDWKADAFLNFYLPSKNGSRKKVGAISLKLSKGTEKALIEWLDADPETNAQKLLNKIVMEYYRVSEDDGNELDLD